jgi:iron(III) transport system substrate-binding protein
MSSLTLRAFACLTLPLLAACGGAAPAASTASSAADPTQVLYQQAQKDGQVAWFDPSAPDVMAPVVQAFEKAYPGVKVNFTQKSASQLVPEIKVQQAAHKVDVDVGNVTEEAAGPTLSDKTASSIDWAKLGIPQDRVFQDLVRYSSNPNVLAYNKQKVNGADLPHAWTDLADTRWRGKMALDGRGGFMNVYISDASQGGPDKGVELAKQLAGQDALFQSSMTQITPMVTSGQSLLGSQAMTAYLAAEKSGAPIDLTPISPVHVGGSYVYVPAGAPHMAAAELLVAWLSTPAGQAALNSAGTGLLGTCDAAQQSAATQALCSRHIQWTQLASVSQIAQVTDYLAKIQQAFGTSVAK